MTTNYSLLVYKGHLNALKGVFDYLKEIINDHTKYRDLMYDLTEYSRLTGGYTPEDFATKKEIDSEYLMRLWHIFYKLRDNKEINKMERKELLEIVEELYALLRHREERLKEFDASRE